jgi:hypothetical protein
LNTSLVVDDFEVAEATLPGSRAALASGAHHPATGHREIHHFSDAA